jgi:hypothetical protein
VTHLHPVSKLRIHGPITPLPYTSSRWCVKLDTGTCWPVRLFLPSFCLVIHFHFFRRCYLFLPIFIFHSQLLLSLFFVPALFLPSFMYILNRNLDSGTTPFKIIINVPQNIKRVP